MYNQSKKEAPQQKFQIPIEAIEKICTIKRMIKSRI